MGTEQKSPIEEEVCWGEATSLLGGERLPPLPTAPLTPEERLAIVREVEVALRRSDHGAVVVAMGRWRRSRWLVGSLLAVSAAAAGFALVLLSDPKIGEVTFEMGVTRGLSRGASTRGVDEIHMRNELGWTAQLPDGRDARDWGLYVVVVTAEGELEALPRPNVEASRGVLRVRGEVGELGLRPGAVTVMLLVGPKGAEGEEVLRVAAAHRSGEAVPGAWAVNMKKVQVVE